MEVVHWRDYDRRVRAGVHAQQAHDQIATFLDRSPGALFARHGATVFQSIVFTHCSTSVEATTVKALGQAAPHALILHVSHEVCP